MNRQEIYQGVANVLIEALNLPEDEVKPCARLRDDLGAESIDFLDIVFRLEREFGIKIPRGELLPESFFQGDSECVDRHGLISKKGLAYMKKIMPHADLSQFQENPKMQNILDLYTVQFLVNYIAWKLKIV